MKIYYVVVVPKIGKPYIAEYNDRIKLKGGYENSFWLFKCDRPEYLVEIRSGLKAYMYCNDFNECLTYEYPNNRTCDVDIFAIDNYERTKLFGYGKNDAELICKKLTDVYNKR